jgi:hypothetical protein
VTDGSSSDGRLYQWQKPLQWRMSLALIQASSSDGSLYQWRKSLAVPEVSSSDGSLWQWRRSLAVTKVSSSDESVYRSDFKPSLYTIYIPCCGVHFNFVYTYCIIKISKSNHLKAKFMIWKHFPNKICPERNSVWKIGGQSSARLDLGFKYQSNYSLWF